jgi:tRNA-modifying protein YgfZ
MLLVDAIGNLFETVDDDHDDDFRRTSRIPASGLRLRALTGGTLIADPASHAGEPRMSVRGRGSGQLSAPDVAPMGIRMRTGADVAHRQFARRPAICYKRGGAEWSGGPARGYRRVGVCECRSGVIVTDVTLFDLSDRAQIELRGSDRQSFLHNFCSNDIKSLQPGQGCEAFVTSIKGRILGHIIVSATDAALWLDSVPGAGEALTAHLDRYLITEEVEIADRTTDVGPLCLVGPGAAEWLNERGLSTDDLPLWGQRSAVLEGIDVIVRRVGFTLADAFELVVAHQHRPQLQEAITAQGIPLGSRDEFESLRIEAGFPHYGIDLSEENIAQEAARNEQAISFTKGCYLGQEPIARLDAMGHTNRQLCRLQVDSDVVPQHGAAVRNAEGADAGRITSAAKAPGGNGVVALAMLKSAWTRAGTPLEVLDTGSKPASSVVR